jgi:hypothetical protein
VFKEPERPEELVGVFFIGYEVVEVELVDPVQLPVSAEGEQQELVG